MLRLTLLARFYHANSEANFPNLFSGAWTMYKTMYKREDSHSKGNMSMEDLTTVLLEVFELSRQQLKFGNNQ